MAAWRLAAWWVGIVIRSRWIPPAHLMLGGRPCLVGAQCLGLGDLAARADSAGAGCATGVQEHIRTVRVHEQGDHPRLGNHLGKQFEAFGIELGGELGDAARLPLGRARLATRPRSTGLPPSAKTIGIVEVAPLAANAATSLPLANITSTFLATPRYADEDTMRLGQFSGPPFRLRANRKEGR